MLLLEAVRFFVDLSNDFVNKSSEVEVERMLLKDGRVGLAVN